MDATQRFRTAVLTVSYMPVGWHKPLGSMSDAIAQSSRSRALSALPVQTHIGADIASPQPLFSTPTRWLCVLYHNSTSIGNPPLGHLLDSASHPRTNNPHNRAGRR